MDNLLEHIGRDTLPKSVIDDFLQWCVWHQARQALVLVLEEINLKDIASDILNAQDAKEVLHIGEIADAQIKAMRATDMSMQISAAEGALFEFLNMVKSSREDSLDAEGVSFFASRVCGWAGWAVSGFTDLSGKTEAEEAAFHAQEIYLEDLYTKYLEAQEKTE